MDQLVKTMKAFSYLMDVAGIEYFRACATSAMREAENRKKVLSKIRKEANIDVEVIDGEEEADLIFSTSLTSNLEVKGSYFYIDVGGGSTECTLIKNGERHTSRSFKIGTVRMLKDKVSSKKWDEARQWIQDIVQDEKKIMAIGSGGNINKIFKEIGKKPTATISAKEIEEFYKYVKSYSYEQRITKLRMRPDRADVILPAARIYSKFMRYAGAQEMIVPKVGLSDGIILELFEDWKREHT